MLFISFVSAAEDVSVGRPLVVKRLWKHARCRSGKEGEGEREAADGERDEVNGNKFSVRRGRKRGERAGPKVSPKELLGREETGKCS